MVKWRLPPVLYGGALHFVKPQSMSAAPTRSRPTRPQRADARRNYEKILAAARTAFAEDGGTTALEEIARRAEVGIGTVYRHFPTRQDLLLAVYVEEVEALAASAADFEALEPWDGLVAWLHRFNTYLATKRVLAEQLMEHFDKDSEVFQECRTLMQGSAAPLLKRAQDAGEARSDVTPADIMHLVIGISRITTQDPDEITHLLDIAIDGLRAR